MTSYYKVSVFLPMTVFYETGNCRTLAYAVAKKCLKVKGITLYVICIVKKTEVIVVCRVSNEQKFCACAVIE